MEKIIKIKKIQKNKKNNHKKEHYGFIVAQHYSVLHRMTLIFHTHSSQFMEWHNVVIVTLNHVNCAPNIF